MGAIPPSMIAISSVGVAIRLRPLRRLTIRDDPKSTYDTPTTTLTAASYSTRKRDNPLWHRWRCRVTMFGQVILLGFTSTAPPAFIFTPAFGMKPSYR